MPVHEEVAPVIERVRCGITASALADVLGNPFADWQVRVGIIMPRTEQCGLLFVGQLSGVTFVGDDYNPGVRLEFAWRLNMSHGNLVSVPPVAHQLLPLTNYCVGTNAHLPHRFIVFRDFSRFIKGRRPGELVTFVNNDDAEFLPAPQQQKNSRRNGTK